MLRFFKRGEKEKEKTEQAVKKTRQTWFRRVGTIFQRSNIDDELWDELEEILISSDVGVGTTMKLLDRVRERIRDEGVREPTSEEIRIDSDDDHIIFNTAEGRLKTRNMHRDPRVAITVFNADNPFEQVTIRGRVVEMTHDGADAHIDSLAKKYLGQDRYPGHTPEEQRVIVKVAPDRITP